MNKLFLTIICINFKILNASHFVTDLFFPTGDPFRSPMMIGIGSDFEFKNNPFLQRIRQGFAKPMPNSMVVLINPNAEMDPQILPVKLNVFRPEFNDPNHRHDYSYFVDQVFLFIGLVMLEYYDGLDHHSPAATEYAARQTLDRFSSGVWRNWLESRLTLEPLVSTADNFDVPRENLFLAMHKAAVRECLKFHAYLSTFIHRADTPTSCCPSVVVRPESCANQMAKIQLFFRTLQAVFVTAKLRLWPVRDINYYRSLVYQMTKGPDLVQSLEAIVSPEPRKTLFGIMPVEISAAFMADIGSVFD